jgi:ethanolamine phosphate phosphodiesterase
LYRIIFNAHTGSFSDFLHADGTREVTVPAMTWKTRGVPGFVITTFDTKGTVTLSCCLLAKEWHVIMGYLAFLCLTALAVKLSHQLE